MPFRATAYQKRLEDAGFEPKMAHAQAAAMEEFVVSELVTMDHFNARLDATMDQINARFDAFMDQFNARFDAFEVKLDARFDSRLTTLRSELKSEISAIGIRMMAMQLSLVRWMVGTVGGATLAIILTLLRVAK